MSTRAMKRVSRGAFAAALLLYLGPRPEAAAGAPSVIGPITFNESEVPVGAGLDEKDLLTDLTLDSLDGEGIPPLSFSALQLAFPDEVFGEFLASLGSSSSLEGAVLLAFGTLEIDFGTDVLGGAFDTLFLVQQLVGGDEAQVVSADLTLRARDAKGAVVSTSEVILSLGSESFFLGDRLTFSAPTPLRSLEIEFQPVEAPGFEVLNLLVLDNLSYTLGDAVPETELEPEVVVSADGVDPASAIGPGGLRVVTWSEDGEIRASLYDGTGAPLREGFRVSRSGISNGSPVASFDGSGNLLFAWLRGADAATVGAGAAGGGSSVVARGFSPQGMAATSEVVLPLTVDEPPSISSSAGGGAVVTVTAGGKTKAQRIGQDLMPQGLPFDVDDGAGQSQARVATAASGDFTVVWTAGGGSASRVLARFFRSDGTPKGAAVRVNAEGTAARAPAVAADALGNVVIVFEQDAVGGSDVLIRRYAAGGSAVGDAQRAHGSAEGAQSAPSVDVNPSGDFAVAWVTEDPPPGISAGTRSASTAGSGTSVVARGFNPQGAGGAEVEVAASEATGEPEAPQVTIDSDDEISVSFRRRRANGGNGGVFSRTVETALPATACAAGPEVLCLNGGRFAVRVTWRDFGGRNGVGRALPVTDDTGTFWFFDEENLEIVLKVLDARGVNGNYWVFYGALSNVEFTITVDDTVTGLSTSYYNPLGTFASVGDTQALPAEGARRAGPRDVLSVLAPFQVPGSLRLAAPGSGCSTAGGVLCLQQSRFEVTIDWRDFAGTSGSGEAVELTDDTGYFWFFDEDNVEVVVKVLDARAFNGSFWVFYGALTNVEYEIKVRDSATGFEKTYENPLRSFGSVGDTEGLPGDG